MPRPRRKPRPPGNAVACCTGRGGHKRRHVRRLQLAVEGDRIRLIWDNREGSPPVAAHREDGTYTVWLTCPACGRDWKRPEDVVIKTVIALGEMQGTWPDGNTPVEVDISRVDRA